eukprot:Amastigsp_a681645_33.p3 type:complete len:140 gc:universal Amastigsp_a681645_33:947-528(-)
MCAMIVFVARSAKTMPASSSRRVPDTLPLPTRTHQSESPKSPKIDPSWSSRGTRPTVLSPRFSGTTSGPARTVRTLPLTAESSATVIAPASICANDTPARRFAPQNSSDTRALATISASIRNSDSVMPITPSEYRIRPI